VGPACQLCLPHRADWPWPLSSVASSHPAPLDLRPWDARRGIYPTPWFPSLIALLNLSSSSPIFNGVKAINAGVNHLSHPSLVLPRPPIKGEHPHRVSSHLSPLLFPSHHAWAAVSPRATAQAPVRPEPSSPCSSPPFAPPPASFGAPERPEAKLRWARHRGSTVHRPTSPGPPCVDPVHGINRWKIICYSGYFGNLAKRSLDSCEINLRSRSCGFCTQAPRFFLKLTRGPWFFN
jgi:hypothetical protein